MSLMAPKKKQSLSERLAAARAQLSPEKTAELEKANEEHQREIQAQLESSKLSAASYYKKEEENLQAERNAVTEIMLKEELEHAAKLKKADDEAVLARRNNEAKDVLRNAGVVLSKHAIERMEERGVELADMVHGGAATSIELDSTHVGGKTLVATTYF